MKKVYLKPEVGVLTYETNDICALRVAGEASANNATVFDGAWAGFTE